MLPKKQRIGRGLSPLLSEPGVVLRNDLFFIKSVSYDGDSRFSVSISKKIAKSAILRNRLRRLGYKLLEKYARIIKRIIKKPVLMRVSWQRIPKDEAEAEEAMKNILNKLTTR